jgi:hypothetical protein
MIWWVMGSAKGSQVGAVVGVVMAGWVGPWAGWVRRWGNFEQRRRLSLAQGAVMVSLDVQRTSEFVYFGFKL